MSPPFRILEECASTNDEAKRWASQGAPHGSWIMAHRQTGGRGRLGRKWLGEEGNLYFSIILRVDHFPHLTWLPMLCAVASVQTLRKFAPQVALQIKWPNDLWISGCKLGGILCESSGGYVIAGVGLNLKGAPNGADFLQPATALEGVLGKPLDPQQVAQTLALQVLRALEQLEEQGPESLAQFYDSVAVFRPGQEVEWADGKGKVLGLGSAGELRVQTPAGERRLFADDVRVRAHSNL
jgi:BirA family biotin operon repressor/biotin-[acetyl-CoA-carboxylase] ligase